MNRKEEMELADMIEDQTSPIMHDILLSKPEREAICAALRASAAPEEGNPAVPPVKRIEMVDYSRGYRMEAEPEWRVQVSGVCADFQTETAANNFRNAILALPSDSGKAAPVALAKIETIVKLALSDGEYIGRHEKDMEPAVVIKLRDGVTAERLKAVRAALAPATEGGGRETSIWLLAGRLAGAELNYRNAYEQLGGSHRETGRAWDKLRQAGNAIREISDSVWEAALSPSPSVGTGTQPISSANRTGEA